MLEATSGGAPGLRVAGRAAARAISFRLKKLLLSSLNRCQKTGTIMIYEQKSICACQDLLPEATSIANRGVPPPVVFGTEVDTADGMLVQ